MEQKYAIPCSTEHGAVLKESHVVEPSTNKEARTMQTNSSALPTKPWEQEKSEHQKRRVPTVKNWERQSINHVVNRPVESVASSHCTLYVCDYTATVSTTTYETSQTASLNSP